MLHTRGLAVLAVAAAASTLMITPAAAGTNTVRYAWVDGCAKKDYTVPCGPWTLTMRSGKDLVLKDAVVFPESAGGKVDKEANAPLAVSGNGRYVNYFRKSDSRLVIHDVVTGSVKALPGKAAILPKGLGMSDLDLGFSNDGRRLVIDYLDFSATKPSVVVDLRAGTTSKLPGGEFVQSFSPDGEYVLTSRSTDDNTTEFAVYDGKGDKMHSQVVPQVVSNNSPIALADDGTTVALVITGSKKARLRTYDLSTDEVSEAVTLRYPATESPTRLLWETSGKLSVWNMRSNANGDLQGYTKRTIDPNSGASPLADSFRFKSGIWTWWLPGD